MNREEEEALVVAGAGLGFISVACGGSHVISHFLYPFL